MPLAALPLTSCRGGGIMRCLVPKRGFAPLAEGSKPIDGEGAEWVIYPRERPGRDSAFNQSLNRCRISVKGDAFLNPTHQDLIDRAKSSASAASKPDASGKTMPVLEAGTGSLSFEDFDDIMDGALRHLRYLSLSCSRFFMFHCMIVWLSCNT